MTTTKYYDTVDPSEADVISPDFSARLPTGVTLASVQVLDVSVSGGVDAGAASRFGSPQVSGKVGLIPFSGLLDGCTYHVRVKAITSDPSVAPVWSFNLPCRKA